MTQLSTSKSPSPHVSLDLDSAELASTYDQTSTRQFDHGKVLIAAIDPKPGERALDIGCGTGRLGEYVANLVAPSGQVVGVDPLPLRVHIAARKNARFSASVGRAEDLSQFADASFDLAYSNSVFHWVLDKNAALREALRVLRPGGRFGINSADADRPHQSQRLVREALVEEGLSRADGANALGTNYRVNATELAHLLQHAGFEHVDVQALTFVDNVEGVDDLLAWSASSSFGNFLSDLSAAERTRVRARLEHKLEARRTDGSIRLERYLVFATARKRLS